jgi:hypothetical protein
MALADTAFSLFNSRLSRDSERHFKRAENRRNQCGARFQRASLEDEGMEGDLLRQTLARNRLELCYAGNVPDYRPSHSAPTSIKGGV